MTYSLKYLCILACILYAFTGSSQSEERYTVKVNLYQPISNSQSEILEDILLTQISYYLNSESSWENNQIVFALPSKKMVSKLDALVKSDVKFHEYEALKDFKGFSETVKKKIENITNRTYEFSSVSESEQKADMLNHQLSELLSILKTELLVFGEKEIYESKEELFSDLTLEEKDAIIEEIENYQDGDPLSTLKIEYTELEANDNSGAFLEDSSDGDLADRILNLLAENAQRLERLESEFMQAQIDSGAENGGGISVATPSNNDSQLLAMLPESMDFYFYYASSKLTGATLLQLNEIVEILAQSNDIKVIITGYTDSSGAPEANLLLSQKRAQAVKDFMLASGMSADRFITNYYGESKSSGDRNQDRRVEIKFYK